MTREEFAPIAGALKASYARYNFLADKEAIELWYQMLKDLSKEAVSVAVQKYILTQKFAPTIADIREFATPTIKMDWAEGWDWCTRAVSKYGSLRYKEAMQYIPEPARTVIKQLGYIELCQCDNLEVFRGQFRKAFEQHVAQVKEQAVLPAPLREKIALLLEG